MRRTLARENFTSARRRRAISLSMLKVPIVGCTRFTLDDSLKRLKNYPFAIRIVTDILAKPERYKVNQHMISHRGS